MRLLHARHDHAGASALEGKSVAERAGNPDGHIGQYLPLHRLPEHRESNPIRRREDQRRGIQGGRGMNDMTPTREQRTAALEGLGCKRKRVEDIRFTQGKGNYVDDVNLAWMPTLAGDVQMVLADGKVLFQNQEVAFVVATDRYAADDGVSKVVVEYEALPVLVDPFKSMAPDAPVLREDLAGKTTGAHGPRKHHNHIFEWSVGDRELTDAAFKNAD